MNKGKTHIEESSENLLQVKIQQKFSFKLGEINLNDFILTVSTSAAYEPPESKFINML